MRVFSRRRPQITLRAVFAFVTFLCALCAFWASWLQPHRRQKAGRGAAARHSASLRVVPSLPGWLAKMVNDELAERIVAIDFSQCAYDSVSQDAPTLTDRDLEAVAGLSFLVEIDLSGCHVPRGALRSLGKLRRVRRFTMYNAAVDDTLIITASEWPDLETFDFGLDRSDAIFHLRRGGSIPDVTEKHLPKLVKLHRLHELRLIGAPLGDDAAAIIARMPQLERLDLSYTRLTDAGAENLRALRDLRTLSLAGTQVTDAAFVSVANISFLERLDCGDTSTGDEGVEKMAALRELKALNLSSTHVSDAAMKSLAAMSRLTDLHLYDTKITDLGMAELRHSPSLINLDLGSTRIGDDGLLSLIAVPTLKKVQIAGVKVTDEGRREFCRARPDVELKLSGTDLFNFHE